MPLGKKTSIGFLFVLCFLLALVYRIYTGEAALTAYSIGMILGTTIAFAIGVFVLLWLINRLS